MYPKTVKKNVDQFNKDVDSSGSYEYTGQSLSARFANERISRSILGSFDFQGKSVLDLGCGDGAYTVEFPDKGINRIVGIDPADTAIAAATKRAHSLGLSDIVHFETGDIYKLEKYLTPGLFDCILIRGVLHHLPDPARALHGLSKFNGTIIVVEPNGNNPVLKLIERFSAYHVNHEECSFPRRRICKWLIAADFKVKSHEMIGLVPFFCPNSLAKFLRRLQPIIERLPVVRNLACGQVIIVASK